MYLFFYYHWQSICCQIGNIPGNHIIFWFCHDWLNALNSVKYWLVIGLYQRLLRQKYHGKPNGNPSTLSLKKFSFHFWLTAIHIKLTYWKTLLHTDSTISCQKAWVSLNPEIVSPLFEVSKRSTPKLVHQKLLLLRLELVVNSYGHVKVVNVLRSTRLKMSTEISIETILAERLLHIGSQIWRLLNDCFKRMYMYNVW